MTKWLRQTCDLMRRPHNHPTTKIKKGGIFVITRRCRPLSVAEASLFLALSRCFVCLHTSQQTFSIPIRYFENQNIHNSLAHQIKLFLLLLPLTSLLLCSCLTLLLNSSSDRLILLFQFPIFDFNLLLNSTPG